MGRGAHRERARIAMMRCLNRRVLMDLRIVVSRLHVDIFTETSPRENKVPDLFR